MTHESEIFVLAGGRFPEHVDRAVDRNRELSDATLTRRLSRAERREMVKNTKIIHTWERKRNMRSAQALSRYLRGLTR